LNNRYQELQSFGRENTASYQEWS